MTAGSSSSSRSYPYRLEFGQLRKFRNENRDFEERWGVPSAGKQADGTCGGCARGLRHALVSDKRCIERERGDAAQRADYITPVHYIKNYSRSCFREFFRTCAAPLPEP